MSFLSAEWRKLALANYAVDPSLLSEYIPPGTELDIWQNRCYVSLVGFMFVNTRLLGIKVPWHVNFEEVNLRFYVKRETDSGVKRGVVFIKEIVPRHAITLVANTIYKENYQTLKMDHRWASSDNSHVVEYRWKSGSQWQKFSVKAQPMPLPIETGSETEFITEHYWGYAKVSDVKTNEYEVTHPRWEHYEVEDYHISVDFKATYGDKFDFLSRQKPESVMLAEGSEITVEPKEKIAL